MTGSQIYIPTEVSKIEWQTAKCDKMDYITAVSCGAVAGLIDVFFVGDPKMSSLVKYTDEVVDDFVKKAAHFFYKLDPRTSGKPKSVPDTLEKCISYLEQSFLVNYDARYAKDLNTIGDTLSSMRPLSHHLLSLAHSPDPIGLIFSIIDQFTGYATFVDKGKIINVVPAKTSGIIPYMQGSKIESMLFCGFVNWIGHLISDIAGSSSTRAPGKIGRGTGIPMPFYEMFLACDFRGIDGKKISDTMIKVFEQGYDFRFGAAMAVPVLIEELSIKVMWMIRQKFFKKKPWVESIPSKKHAELRIMLIVGNGTLCAIDGADAAIRGLASGNVIIFICRLNFVGWIRLAMLVLRELEIRYGLVIKEILSKFVTLNLSIFAPTEKQKILDMVDRLKTYDFNLNRIFRDFVVQVEKEYVELFKEMNATFDDTQSSAYQAEHSITLAKVSGVSEEKIVHNNDELDKLFL